VSRVLLLHVDGALPNIALMRIASHHRSIGDSVELRRVASLVKAERQLFDAPDLVYASCIFEKSRPIAARIMEVYPQAIIGGTGWDEVTKLPDIGITTKVQDYTDYPKWRQSIGYTQRGCRFACSFCKVSRTEGKVTKDNTVPGLWRGDPWPRELILLDNDFFGEPDFQDRIAEIREGKFKVSFCQGINARALTEEAAEAMASVDYRDISMKHKRVYSAWDNRDDEHKLFRGLKMLVNAGIKPDSIMVYVLIGYDHKNKTALSNLVPDDFRRMEKLREFGARPYPMPYHRSREMTCFQWYAMNGRHKKMKWEELVKADYRPERLGHVDEMPLFGDESEDDH
jgi:hypothetical protein